MLPKHIIRIIQWFDCLGFFTEYKSNKWSRKLRYTISCIFLIYFATFNYNLYLIKYTPIIKIVDLIIAQLQYFGALFTYLIIYIESFIKRNAQRTFWQRNAWHDHHIRCQWEQNLLKFYWCLIVLVVYLVLLSFRVQGEMIVFVVTVTVLTRLYQCRIFYYSIYMEVIRVRLKVIHMYAVAASVLVRVPEGCLKSIRQTYRRTFKSVNCMNEIFGYSQLTVLSYSFFVLLTDCNWCYTHFDLRNTMRPSGKLKMKENLSSFQDDITMDNKQLFLNRITGVLLLTFICLVNVYLLNLFESMRKCTSVANEIMSTIYRIDCPNNDKKTIREVCDSES